MVSSSNSKNTDFFPYYLFYLLSCLIDFDKPSSTMLTKNEWSANPTHPYDISTLRCLAPTEQLKHYL